VIRLPQPSSQTRGWALCPAIAALVLAGPISEELLFRGLLLGRFRANGYLVSGTIISTVIFMLSHSDPRQYLELCGGGLLLAWLYHRTNSLWPPIALHALVNAWYAIQTVFDVCQERPVSGMATLAQPDCHTV
jgi:membrane protease YdiL (CAAX protease family)